MARDEAAWAEIRRAYEAGGETVSALAARVTISVGAIYRRARCEGWARRSQAAGSGIMPERKLKTGSKPKRGSPPQASSKRAAVETETIRSRSSQRAAAHERTSREELIARLYGAMDAKLQRLEHRMAMDEEMSAAESERETRELGSMIRSFEKVTAFAAAIEKREKSLRRPPVVATGDAERMREEIAQRLERLCPDRDVAPKSGASE